MWACRKTLQGITLLWTLLQNGHELLGGEPMAKRIIICCPTSLVSNWDSECGKWLKVCTAWVISLASGPVCFFLAFRAGKRAMWPSAAGKSTYAAAQ